MGNTDSVTTTQLYPSSLKAALDHMEMKSGTCSNEILFTQTLTCLLRNLYAGEEATVRTEHGTTDWFKIGEGVCQSCILSPCLFNFYAEYIMQNAGMEESQAGIKIARPICR